MGVDVWTKQRPKAGFYRLISTRPKPLIKAWATATELLLGIDLVDMDFNSIAAWYYNLSRIRFHNPAEIGSLVGRLCG